jgi:hypothetical protein
MMNMETHFIIEAMDYVSHELFIVYFSDRTYVLVTAEELKRRFADSSSRLPNLMRNEIILVTREREQGSPDHS